MTEFEMEWEKVCEMPATDEQIEALNGKGLSEYDLRKIKNKIIDQAWEVISYFGLIYDSQRPWLYLLSIRIKDGKPVFRLDIDQPEPVSDEVAA